MIQLIESIYWFLPIEVKKIIFERVFYKRCKFYQQQRVIEGEDYSLKPFDDNKCIFVHIPKTAGISVAKSLFGNMAGGHKPLGIYKLIYSREEFNNYFKFTFVRNPWDRLLSAYAFLRAGGMTHRDKQWAREHLSAYKDFDSFVRGWVNRVNIYLERHFIPQYKFICIRDKVPEVDFIGYFENLAEDFSFVRNNIGLDFNHRLLFHNKSKFRGNSYKDYYTEETKEIVANVYREDIDILGYDFENTTKRSKTLPKEHESEEYDCYPALG